MPESNGAAPGRGVGFPFSPAEWIAFRDHLRHFESSGGPVYPGSPLASIIAKMERIEASRVSREGA